MALFWFSRAWAALSRRSSSISYSLAFNTRMAIARFWCWLRSARHTMLRPVGKWRRRTAVSTLFTFCPPLPPARMVVISMSLSGTSMLISSSSSGTTSTAAKAVWRV